MVLNGRGPLKQNKTDSKVRCKMSFTVQIWPSFLFIKNQVYSISFKQTCVRSKANPIKIMSIDIYCKMSSTRHHPREQ